MEIDVKHPILFVERGAGQLLLNTSNVVIYHSGNCIGRGVVFGINSTKRTQLDAICGKYDKMLVLMSDTYTIHCVGTSGCGTAVRNFAIELYECAEKLCQAYDALYNCAFV